MKKLILAALLSVTMVMGSFALDMAGKINQFGSFDNVKALAITVYPAGAFTMNKTFKYEQIKSVTQEGDLLLITADTGKYQYELALSVNSILDIKMIKAFDKKANKKVATINILITENANAPALGDWIVKKFMTVDSTLMVPGAVPGMGFIPLGCKIENVDSIQKVGGDIINVKFKNKFEWFMPEGAYCMAFTCKTVTKGTTSLQFYGAGNCSNEGYAKVLADKINAGDINRILFYGQYIAPIKNYEKETVSVTAEAGNYMSVVFKEAERKEVDDGSEKGHSVITAVGEGWYWDTFKMSSARFGLYKNTDFLLFY
jgi:hypothetical protein